MSWEDIIKEKENASKVSRLSQSKQIGSSNPNDRTYTKEELKDLDDVVVSNGETAREYAQAVGKEIVPNIYNWMHEKEYDTLTWVTNDVRKVALESVMEEFRFAMEEYFNIE